MTSSKATPKVSTGILAQSVHQQSATFDDVYMQRPSSGPMFNQPNVCISANLIIDHDHSRDYVFGFHFTERFAYTPIQRI